MPRTVVFCGGGSVGHIAPSVAVARAACALDTSVVPLFFCAAREEETRFLTHEGLQYRCVHAAKFPRGLSLGWLSFPFVFAWSCIQAFLLLQSAAPAALFSKGGHISVPVCLAARMLGLPIVLHESDATGGLGNTLISRLATTVCVGMPGVQLAAHAVYTGNPVRPEIAQGSVDAGRRITGFSGRRPIVLVIGGSQGSLAINQAVDAQFEQLLDAADIVHLTGTGKALTRQHARYWSRPFVTEELPHLYALADVVVTRAGAGVLSELAAVGKAAVVVPLREVAQDHQQRNAEHFASANAIVLLPQEQLAGLTRIIRDLLNDAEKRQGYGKRLQACVPPDAATTIARALLDAAKLPQ